MDPWPAPCPKSNDYWCFTCDQKRSGQIILQTSVIFTISTQCNTKGPYKEGEIQTSKVLLPTSSKAASSVRWTVSPFNDASSHLLTDRNKSPHYVIITHTNKIGFTLCHSPLQTTKDKLYNSYTESHWTVQHNVQINEQLHAPQMFRHLPYFPNMPWLLKGLYQGVGTLIKRCMQNVIQLCQYSRKLCDIVHVRCQNTPDIWSLRFKYLKFIHIHVFTNKVNVTQVVHTHWNVKVVTFVKTEQTDTTN
jgi:hypothetical protein